MTLRASRPARTRDGGGGTFGTPSPSIRDRRGFPVTEGENVAIYNTKTRRYLRFHRRVETKAEPEWNRTPDHERQVPGQSEGRFALFNDRVDRYLVHQFRNYGINLGWLAEGTVPVQTFSVGLAAQPVVRGWVPYLGSFGGGTQGSLLSVQSATLLFVSRAGRRASAVTRPRRSRSRLAHP